MSGNIRMAILDSLAFPVLALVAVTGVLGGCVTLSAPDKPIVINLNINIKQEVVYRLDGKAKAVIDENAEIF